MARPINGGYSNIIHRLLLYVCSIGADNPAPETPRRGGSLGNGGPQAYRTLNFSWVLSNWIVPYCTAIEFSIPITKFAGPSSHAGYGVGLRPLACWDCRFESRREHEYLPLISIAFCQVEVSSLG